MPCFMEHNFIQSFLCPSFFFFFGPFIEIKAMSGCMGLTEARQHCSRYVPAGYVGFQDRAMSGICWINVYV